MGLISNIRHRWHEFFRKRRFTMLNATDNSEEWHIHLSPASVLAGLTAFALMLFILILSLIAYTPVLEFLPGYRTIADRSKENLVRNIIRLDSMERMMNDMMTYNENIALVLEGRTPAGRSFLGAEADSLHNDDKGVVARSQEDSILRAEMEGDGPYSLSANASGSRHKLREAMQLVSPVEGIVTEHFDIGEHRFGVGIAVAPGARIVAIDTGTVIQTLWTPDNGSVILIQHTNNLISVYRNVAQTLVTTGLAVRSGDQIGYAPEVAEDASAEESRPLFEFELWSNGKPVDPEGYAIF